MTIKQVLSGHTSPETAFVVDDYPYGFRLRCKIRYWVETKKGKGQRVVSQTTNPKRPGEVWNKPKASTYSDLRVLFIEEETGHVQNDAFSIGYGEAPEFEAFLAKYGSAFTSKYEQDAIQSARIVYCARKHMKELAGGNIFDVKDPAERSRIVAQAKSLAVKEVLGQ